MTTILPEVIIIGMGPAGPDLMTKEALDYLESPIAKFVRTERHLASENWIRAGATPLDFLYLKSESFEKVYHSIAQKVISEADKHGRVIYCVPGSPLILENSADIIRNSTKVRTKIVQGMSFLDLAYERLNLDPVTAGLSLLDWSSFQNPYFRLKTPALIGQCWNLDILSEIKLRILECETADNKLAEGAAVILHHLGHSDERIEHTSIRNLDQTIEVDHLSCIYLPALNMMSDSYGDELLALTKLLRLKCPWDQEQTHLSLGRHLLEETYEVLDAITDLDGQLPIDNDLMHDTEPLDIQDHDDSAITSVNVLSADFYAAAEHLQEELGDLLVQIIFHAVIAEEEELFSIRDIIVGVCKKLIIRHPHVFSDKEIDLTPFLNHLLAEVMEENKKYSDELIFKDPNSSFQVEGNWEQIKKKEKQRQSIFDGISDSLPTLLYIEKLERKLRSIDLGFTTDEISLTRLQDLLFDFHKGDVVKAGDLFLELARYALYLGMDPEHVTRQAVLRLESHARELEEKRLDAT